MHLKSTLNNAFLSLGLASILAGLIATSTMPVGTKVDPFEIIPLAAFIVFFRIKMWLDDGIYFRDTSRKNFWFDIGMILAVVSWCFWVLAGYLVKDTKNSYRALFVSIVVLTIWTAASALHRKEGYFRSWRFVVFNMIYATVLILLGLDIGKGALLGELLRWGLVVGTMLDFLAHKSLRHLHELHVPAAAPSPLREGSGLEGVVLSASGIKGKAGPGSPGSLEIVVNGHRCIRVPVGFDTATLVRLIEILEQCPTAKDVADMASGMLVDPKRSSQDRQ